MRSGKYDLFSFFSKEGERFFTGQVAANNIALAVVNCLQIVLELL